MYAIIVMVIASVICVECNFQQQAIRAYPCNPTPQPCEVVKILPQAVPAQYVPQCVTTQVIKPCDVVQTPAPCAPAPDPAIPFITDLASCPDLAFIDILSSPVGSLDPIFSIYGCPDTKCACKCSSLTSPLVPLGLSEDCLCGEFLRRIPIPPPFI